MSPIASGRLVGRGGCWRRAAGAAADLSVGVVTTLLLRSSLGLFFARRAVVTLRMDAPDSWWKGPVPLILGAFGEFVYLLPFTLFLVWSLDPLTGATVGKRVLGLRVCDEDGQAASRQRLWRRSAVQTVGLWGWVLALLTGRWEIALMASLAGGLVLGGSLLMLGPTSRALHDRLSRTSVRRRRSRRAS